MAADAIITSNTSSLPAARIFAELRAQGARHGDAFFAPAWRNPVVEVIDWPGADPALVAHLRWIFCVTGKVPLVTADVPCFMLDRVFDNWCNEAALLLERAARPRSTASPPNSSHAGPFFVLNLARGNPIIIETNTLQADEEGEHYRPAAIFRSVDNWVTVAPGKRSRSHRRSGVGRFASGCWACSSPSRWTSSIARSAMPPIWTSVAASRWASGAGRSSSCATCGAADAARISSASPGAPGMPAPARPLPDYQRFLRHVLVDDLEGIKVITLRRPEALNALHDEMTDEILAVIRRFERDDGVIGFVLTGYGTRAFCAGADIGRFPSLLATPPRPRSTRATARGCSCISMRWTSRWWPR